MATATDWDHRIIDGVSVSLGGMLGCEDDVQRLLAALTPTDAAGREKALAEIAVAFARWAQDLKERRKVAERERDHLARTLDGMGIGYVLPE